eukprot:scaffold4502_cov119-Isochrysis_galbana.AAC.10
MPGPARARPPAHTSPAAHVGAAPSAKACNARRAYNSPVSPATRRGRYSWRPPSRPRRPHTPPPSWAPSQRPRTGAPPQPEPTLRRI